MFREMKAQQLADGSYSMIIDGREYRCKDLAALTDMLEKLEEGDQHAAGKGPEAKAQNQQQLAG